MSLTCDQERCVNTLDRAIVVAAGAGSGKTFTLTARIVHALESGFIEDIGQVMAITFTRKAAGELKSRIKAALRANGMIDQALKVDGAWISTIHGMCARILRAHAIELGLDPAFVVGEAPELKRLLDTAVDRTLTQMRLERPDDMAALFSEYPASAVRGASVAGMVARLVELAGGNPRGAAAFVIPESRIDPASSLMQTAQSIDALIGWASEQKASAKRDAWLAEIEPVREEIEATLRSSQGDRLDAASVLRLLAGVRFNKQFGAADYKDAVDEARRVLCEQVISLRLAIASGHLRLLADIAEAAGARFAQAKRAEGLLDNGDLLVLAARSLTENPQIAASYTDAFKLIMVDEFQDTDQLQVDMVKLLAGPGFERLCTVGDAQQSIYRFRGADVSVYRRHLDEVSQRGAQRVIELHKNFRSHRDILAYVRQVFSRPGMFGGAFMDLEAARDEAAADCAFADAGPRVIIQHTVVPHAGGAPGALTEVRARRIAARFAELAAAGRPASDMALLLGAMAHAEVYARALRDAGLACVIAGGTVFSSSTEAQAVLDAVRVLADPHDTCSLYRLLAGPMFCLDDEELLMLATGADEEGAAVRRPLDRGLQAWARQTAHSSADTGDKARIACATRVIVGALRAVGSVPVSDIVEKMAVDAGWFARFQEAGPEGLAGAGNVLKAVRFLADAQRGEGRGPAQVAGYFAELLDGMKEGPGALSAGAGDFVRIMTIHASKGLEFPIVAVSELEDRAAIGPFLAEEVAGRIYLSLDLVRSAVEWGGSANPSGSDARAAFAGAFSEDADEADLAEVLAGGCDAFLQRAALAQREAIGEAEERKRLLYVALTRAREALVVSLGGTYSQKRPSGIPDSTLAEAARALGYGADENLPDRATYAFGGDQPALVERWALAAGETADEACAEKLSADGSAALAGHEGRPAEHAVALPAEEARLESAALRLARAGVFSYSSMADASHGSDLVAGLAQAFSTDRAGGDAPAVEVVPDASVVFDTEEAPCDPWATAWNDDPFWSGGGASLFGNPASDADKATDLGTAFHRLAQYAVVSREPGAALAYPPDERIEALSRTCGLGPAARSRLEQALDRWFGSAFAASLARFEDVRAEVPFYVQLPTSSAPAHFLEGEIDLLAVSADRQAALVVDYKTGGSPDEAPAQLALKHALQASCYAYALLRDGFTEIDAAFVRVEQADPAEPDEPQIVRYHFVAGDRSLLEESISAVMSRARCA